MTEPDLSWCRERLRYWSEEIYCDRFAIALAGPAFCFAYIELWDLIGTSDIDEAELVEFRDTHPSDACRLAEHYDQLKKGGWWRLLGTRNTKTNYVTLIRELAAIEESHYVFESDQKADLANPVLRAFLKIRPKIASLVAQTFGPELRDLSASVRDAG